MTTSRDSRDRTSTSAGTRWRGRRLWRQAALVGVTATASLALATSSASARGGGPPTPATDDAAAPAQTPVSLTVRPGHTGTTLQGDFQGFSVESADLAHGFLTRRLMAHRLDTLAPHGVIRVGGYSMDLVWPALGKWAGEPAPTEAIGGTVDQSDLNELARLARASGWKVSIGLPLKKIIDPSKIKNPTKDPSPAVTLPQVVAEVKAAQRTLGDDLVGVEIGNEYDNVTTLTSAEMWTEVKRYKSAIDRALPHADVKVIAPSANTAKTNTRLDDFVTALQRDRGTNETKVLHEISSHLYPGSHCGSSNATMEQLLSPEKYVQDQSKLDGIMDISSRLRDRIPMTINESNSASCSGQPGVSNAYGISLWSLDYQMQVARSGIRRLQFHTNTAAVCGDFKARDSDDYPISYRYYGAFCAQNQAALDADRLSATPLYYGLWAFHQVPEGKFVPLGVSDTDLPTLRAYGVQSAGGTLTLVLLNLQDPAAADSATQALSIHLPRRYRDGRSVTLASSDTAGLSSLDSSKITLGGRGVDGKGLPTGTKESQQVRVAHKTASVELAPGTAQIVTLKRGR